MDLLQQTLADASSPYALLVLSAGTGRNPLINRMLVVDAPLEMQKQRVASRDHSAPETIDAIIAAQPTRAARLALADDIIDNSGLPTALDKQVETLHQQYLRFADYD
jgi:dephospho-CoA kinase